MKFYECQTCKQINGTWRVHCQICGTVPAMYCELGLVYKIVLAQGAERQGENPLQKLKLQTVNLDYYAGA